MTEQSLSTWKFYICPDEDRRINVTLILDGTVSDMLHRGYRPAWAAILEFLQDQAAETEEE